MTSLTKRKFGAFGLRGVGVAASVGAPAAAVLEVFPFMTEDGTVDGAKLGIGGILCVLLALFGLRRQIWPVIKAKLHVTSVWALIFWGVLWGILLGIERMVPLLPALRTICLAGLAGTAAGQVADSVAGKLDPAAVLKVEVPAKEDTA